MKRFFLSLKVFLAVTILATTGCNKDSHDDATVTGSIAVNLTSNIAPASTQKSANGKIEAIDGVGLYMKRAGQPLTSANAVYDNANNIVMSTSPDEKQTLLVSDRTIMYPVSGNVDFVAYYPHNVSSGSDYIIDVNVADQASGLTSEILYSNNATDQEPTSKAVNLHFMHPLAKLRIIVTGNPNVLDPDYFMAMTGSIEGMNTQAQLNLENGELIVDKQSKQPVTMYMKSVSYSSATFEALVLPTTETDSKMTFVFNIDGKTCKYEHSANYESNSQYIYNFIIDHQSQAVTLDKTGTALRNVSVHDTDTDEMELSFMTMKTAKAGEVKFGMKGTGMMLIDWGDGTRENHSMSGKEKLYSHVYSGAANRTISIYGEKIDYFDCGKIYDNENQLTDLDVSGNVALTYLRTVHNKLTSMDLTRNTALARLLCENNLINNIDLTGNPALIELRISHNQITNLDVSKNTELIFLCCAYNNLTNLDIADNATLMVLDCGHNQLADFDASNNTALIDLRVNDNMLKNLNVSKNTDLSELFCANNQLKSLDLSKNTALTGLYCKHNQLTALDVVKNTVLADLICSDNQLKSLDVSQNSELLELVCSKNQITGLDLSNNTKLVNLICSENQLTVPALNAMFGTLHGNPPSLNYQHKTVLIAGNPGTADCNRSIAMEWGWEVDDVVTY